jgi:hypothetical protein
LENIHTEVDVNKARETVKREYQSFCTDSLGYYELKKNKPWFDERCSELLGTSEIAVVTGSKGSKGDNLNNITRETSRQFKIYRVNIQKKIEELAPKSKNRNIRDLYRGIFKRG